MFDWLLQNKSLLIGIGVFSIITFIGSLILIPILIVNIKPDYFVKKKRDFKNLPKRYILFFSIGLVFKNILGVLFILAGIAMLVLPGQGVLTILIGISFIDFPGKRKLEIEIIQKEPVQKAINWIREKAGREPLIIPED